DRSPARPPVTKASDVAPHDRFPATASPYSAKPRMNVPGAPRSRDRRPVGARSPGPPDPAPGAGRSAEDLPGDAEHLQRLPGAAALVPVEGPARDVLGPGVVVVGGEDGRGRGDAVAQAD